MSLNPVSRPRSLGRRGRFAVSMIFLAALQGGSAFANCIGDCDLDNAVTVDELATGIEIALREGQANACLAFDADTNGEVTVDEIVRAIDAVLSGCPPPNPPTPTPPFPGEVVLSLVQTLSDGVGATRGLARARSIVTSPDGSNVYVGSEVPDGGIVVFRREQSTSELVFSDLLERGSGGTADLDLVRDIAIAPDGARLYATTPETELLVFARNPSTGHLTPLGPVSSRSTPLSNAVTVAPDGRHIYVASVRYGLAVFHQRTPETVDRLQEEPFGLNTAPVDLVVSPNGDALYTFNSIYPPAPPSSYEVSVFRFDAVTEMLHLIEPAVVGDRPVISQAFSGAITPNGNDLFVVRGTNRAHVVTFTRNTVDGTLSLDSISTNVPDLGIPTATCLSSNGSLLFIGAIDPIGYGRIATFSKNRVSGKLELVDLHREEEFGDIHTPSACTSSPDSGTLYVTERAGTIRVFSVRAD